MRVTLVAGMPRQGKTTLALEVARREAHRLLVLDPARSEVLASVEGFGSWAELATWLQTPAADGKWERALRSKEPADYALTLRHLEYLRHTTVLVDEVLTFTGDLEALPWLTKAARTSAHYGGGTGLNLLMTAQRPKDVPPDVRAMVTRLFMFQTREPGDLEWLAKFTQDPSIVERVGELPAHAWLEYPSSTREGDTNDEHERQGAAVGNGRRGAAVGAVPAGAEVQPDSPAPGAVVASGNLQPERAKQ